MQIWKPVVATFLMILLSAVSVPAQESSTPPEQSPAGMPDCRAMMQKKQAMHQQMQKMDENLRQLVEGMKAATGDQKVDAVAAVVEELVSQHRTMHQKMQSMGPMMMNQQTPCMQQHPCMQGKPMHGLKGHPCPGPCPCPCPMHGGSPEPADGEELDNLFKE